jgi:hypothetical protein
VILVAIKDATDLSINRIKEIEDDVTDLSNNRIRNIMIFQERT